LISDNIGTLFSSDPSDETPLTLRQGVVESWDPDTGENSIQVGGATVVNIPALTSESASLAAGDVVCLLTKGNSWLLVGKVTTPGDPGTVPTWVGDITALAPLTELATVTDGLVMTGTTSASDAPEEGMRVVWNDPAYPRQIVLFSGDDDEIVPARIFPVLGSSTSGVLELHSPEFHASGAYAYLTLVANSDGTVSAVLAAATSVRAESDNLDLWGFAKVRIGDSSDFLEVVGNVVTEADLSSLTNTFPTFPYYNAWISSQAAVASGANTTVTGYTDEGSPASSGITRSSGTFTVPTSGRYKLTGQLYWPTQATPTGQRIASWALVSPLTTLASHTVTPSAVSNGVNHVEKTVRLTAGDELIFRFTQTSGGSLAPLVATRDLSFINIEWVGP
jgi:hypothetical protein